MPPKKERKNIKTSSRLTAHELSELDNYEGKRWKEVNSIKSKKLLRDNIFHCRVSDQETTKTGRESTDSRSSVGSNNVLILTRIKLTENKLAVLGKGLNVCPASRNCNEFQLIVDLDNFSRSLHLWEYFHGKPQNEASISILPSQNH